LFEFVRTNSKGAGEVFQMMRITNAKVVALHQYINESNLVQKDILKLEDVSFAFQRIEIKNRTGTMAIDDGKSV